MGEMTAIAPEVVLLDELRSTDAEADLLGIYLADPSKREEIEASINPLDITEPVFRRCLLTMKMLRMNGVPVTPAAVVEAMVTDADILDLGGLQYFADLAEDAY